MSDVVCAAEAQALEELGYYGKFPIIPEDYKTLFIVAFIPGLFAILASFLLKDKAKTQQQEKKVTSLFSFLRYWKTSHDEYRKIVTGLLAFTLFYSSDVFLLLKAKQAVRSGVAQSRFKSLIES